MDAGLARAGHTVIALCERDEWRRSILAARFPGVPIFDDVRGVTKGALERRLREVGGERGGADVLAEGRDGGDRIDAHLTEIPAPEEADTASGRGGRGVLHGGPIAWEDSRPDGRLSPIDARSSQAANTSQGPDRGAPTEGRDGDPVEAGGHAAALQEPSATNQGIGDRGRDGAGSGVSDLRGQGPGRGSYPAGRPGRTDGNGEPSTPVLPLSQGEVTDGSSPRGGVEEGGAPKGSLGRQLDLLVGGFP